MILKPFFCAKQTEITGLQLQSMEAKSVSDLSKKDTIITTLETASCSIVIYLKFTLNSFVSSLCSVEVAVL
jgi:hypothetical protein